MVEFALILPLLMMLLLGAIDVGRGVAVNHTLVEAARAGCRLYAVKTEATEQDVRDIIAKVMSEADIEKYEIDLYPDPSVEPAHLSAVSVVVSARYDDVAWSPRSWFLAGKWLTGVCTMPADTGEAYDGGEDEPDPPADDGDDGDADDDDDDGDGQAGDDDDDDDDRRRRRGRRGRWGRRGSWR